MDSKKKTIIGIIGGVGSGKDTVADYISQKLAIPSFQISQPLKDLAKEKNIEPTRENLVKIGSDLVREKGPDFLAQLAIDKIDSEKGIITGIRVLDIIEYLRNNSNLILLAVIANPKVRFERSVIRNKLGEADTIEEFIENERKENSAPNVQRLFECLELADYSITNEDDIETLFKKVDEFLMAKSLL